MKSWNYWYAKHRDLLSTVRDKLGDDIDVKDWIIGDGNEDDKNGTIAALYGEQFYHQEE